MLKRKKRIALMLKIWDSCGNVVYDDRLDNLRLPDEEILALSVEFFDDPEPCQIHKSACMVRAFSEIEAACGKKSAIEDLPERIRGFLKLYNVGWLCVHTTSDDCR